MASRGRSRKGKVVEDIVTEDKENNHTRRTGRAKKPVNYADSVDSPAAKKTATGKTKIPKTEEKTKTVQQNTTQKGSRRQIAGNTEPEDKSNTKTSKSKASVKSRNKRVNDETDSDIHVENKAIKKDQTRVKDKETDNVKVENKKIQKTSTKTKDKLVESNHVKTHDEKSKHNNKRERNEDTCEDRQIKCVKTETKSENNVTELDTSGISDIIDRKRTKGKQTGRLTKEKSRKPLVGQSESVQNVQRQDATPKRRIEQNTNENVQNKFIKKSPPKQNTEQNTSEVVKNIKRHESTPKGQPENKEHTTQKKDAEEIAHNDIYDEETSADNVFSEVQSNYEKASENKDQQKDDYCENIANSTFTLENVLETPVTTNNKRTPCRRSTQQNTPSSESRMSLVLNSIRKESLSGNTPAGHSECALKMGQVYEILQLVTDQLGDLKTEMEKVQSTNESTKKDLETTKENYRKLKEEMNNLKNETINQMKTLSEELQKDTVKPTINQNELDILWEQCDGQKKTIRSLHHDLDNVNLEFNEKFDKYKKAMVFILCKTRPEMKHSDVSDLRHLLNKTEQHLDLTLDEICSTMESDFPESTPMESKVTASGPSKEIPSITITGKVRIKKNKTTVILDHINGNLAAEAQTTPIKDEENLNPFQSKNRLQTTPNITVQTRSSPRSANRLKTTPNRERNMKYTTPIPAQSNPFQSKHRLKRTPLADGSDM